MKYLKAIFATVLAFLGALATATETSSHLTTHVWVVIVISALVAGGTVWGVPNLPSGVDK